jgi:hypothetical protein
MPVGRVGVLAVGLALTGAFATGAGLGQLDLGQLGLPSWWTPEGKPPPREFPVLEPSRPVRISVPSIGLRAGVHGVGLAEDGSIDVPAASRHQEAGWYRESPTPGQFGPAIIVGHVDSRTGPAVFHGLRELRPGAKIEISRRDGSVAIFEVNSVERFDKKHLPTRRLYADFSRPSLRLITCGGRWLGGSTGYADNVVVFASLIRARRP